METGLSIIQSNSEFNCCYHTFYHRVSVFHFAVYLLLLRESAAQ